MREVRAETGRWSTVDRKDCVFRYAVDDKSKLMDVFHRPTGVLVEARGRDETAVMAEIAESVARFR